MTLPRHKGDTKTFAELNRAEQAHSISAQIMNLSAAIEHHIRDSENQEETRNKCIRQVERLLQRLRP